MAAFLGIIWLNGFAPHLHPWAYAARTIVVGGLLIVCWRFVTRPTFTHIPLAIAIGVLGFVQWIGMEHAIVAWRQNYPDKSFMHWLIGFFSVAYPPGDFIPTERIQNPVGFWLFIAVRFLGPILVVPVMEELFWRDWLWRSFASPNDFTKARIGERDVLSIMGVAAAFTLVHPARLTSLVWALLIAWLLIRTRSIGACIIAHAITNGLLGVYILVMWKLGHPVWWFW